MGGRRTWIDGDRLYADDVQSYLMDQAVARFADATERDDQWADPPEGAVCYVLDPGELELFDGAAWGAVSTGSTPALDDLTDVNAPTPSGGDVLTWDDGAGEWIAAAPTGGSGTTELLGYAVRTAGDVSVTSSSMADLPSSISVTFTAPASGNVLVRLSATVGATSTNSAYHSWGLRESTTTIAGAVGESIAVRNSGSTGAVEELQGASKVFVLTGISAGSHTYKWAAACSSSGGTIKAGANSPAVMEVWALP